MGPLLSSAVTGPRAVAGWRGPHRAQLEQLALGREVVRTPAVSVDKHQEDPPWIVYSYVIILTLILLVDTLTFNVKIGELCPLTTCPWRRPTSWCWCARPPPPPPPAPPRTRREPRRAPTPRSSRTGTSGTCGTCPNAHWATLDGKQTNV